MSRFLGCVIIDGVWIGWIDLLTTYIHSRLGTTGNYSGIANLHNSQITPAPTKPFSACCIVTIRFLATASNSGDSSASRPQVILSQRPVQNSCQLSTLLSLPCRAQLRCQTSIDSLPSLNSPPSINSQLACGPRYIASRRTQQKTPFFYCCVLVSFRGKVFTGRYQETAVCWFAHCIATTVHATVSFRVHNYGTARNRILRNWMGWPLVYGDYVALFSQHIDTIKKNAGAYDSKEVYLEMNSDKSTVRQCVTTRM
jgi:hypothetical protein